MRMTKLSAWVAATVLGLSVITRAAPLDTEVPQDAIIYLGWTGAQALEPQYAKSNLKGIIDASEARQFITQQLPKLVAMAAKNDPQAPQTIAKLQTGFGIAWQHPSAFYFCPLEDINPGTPPTFRFGLICQAGADAKTLADLLNEALTKAPPPPQLPMRVMQEGTTVALIFGKADTAADRKKGGGLAAAPAYVKAMGHLKASTPAIATYLDIAGGVALFNDALVKTGAPPEIKARFGTGMDALGLNGLMQLVTVAGFDGKEWNQQAFLGVSGPHKGVQTLMSKEPLNATLLDVVPKDAVSFSALKFDLPAIFTEMRTVVGKIDDPTLRELDVGLAQLGGMIGMNIEQDILAPLGSEWVFYRAPMPEGGNSFALVQKLRDADRMTKTIAAAEAHINQMGAGRFKIEKMTASKIDFSSVSFLQYSAAWTVRNGYLYISTVDGIASAVKQVENKLPGVTENESYKAAMTSLPQGIKPTTITYAHPAKLYPELRRALLGLLPLARAAGVDLPAGLLPDTADVSAFMTPGAAVSWWDADGLHVSSHSAFPGAEVIAGNPGGPMMVASVAMGAGIALPALTATRQRAQGGPIPAQAIRAPGPQDANFRALAQACVIFAADNGGKMPDDLARLVAAGLISPQQLVTSRAKTSPLDMSPEITALAKSDFAKFSTEVALHSDIIYLGKNMPNNAGAQAIIAYERPGTHTPNGLNVAFQDAHTELVPWAVMEQRFTFTNDYLRKAGLQLVDIQDLRRQAGLPQAGPAPQPAGLP